ncbi:hypothetical protein FS749_002301 [Ceratobasidium sp. UAMH 11750]|nr:hypothetical protein FS749_002301 [Ceratobasidium sp. UAMH 11750]
MSTPSESPFRYIEPAELSELMRSGKEPMTDYVVVDVRDDDFVGGNIVGCVRAPSNTYLATVNELVTKTKDVPKLIFHCALSQLRGPKAARVYAETRNNRLNPGETSEQEIFVLRGGFTTFQALFKNDPVLVEKWDKEIWETVFVAV